MAGWYYHHVIINPYTVGMFNIRGSGWFHYQEEGTITVRDEGFGALWIPFLHERGYPTSGHGFSKELETCARAE